MITLHNLDSVILLSRAKELLSEERRITVLFLEYLEEIDSRMLYAEMGYSSLWDFTVKELGLSEGSAQRRIQAMRLWRKVPEVNDALETGSLSLSNAARIHSFSRSEKKQGRVHDLRALLEKIKGKTQQECEHVLLEISPRAAKPEGDRLASAQGDRELKFTVSAEVYEKLQRLKGLIAHSKPDATYAELTDYMVTDVLSRLEKKKWIAQQSRESREERESPRKSSSSNDACIPFTAAAAAQNLRKQKSAVLSKISESLKSSDQCSSGQRIYLSVMLRRAVWARSGGRCEYASETHRCHSTFRLEIDHIQPLALGGSHDFENLRLICWHHNQQQAIMKLGRSKHQRSRVLQRQSKVAEF